MAGGGNVAGGTSGGASAAPPNPFQYSPQGNLTGMYGSQGNISGSDINNLIQRNMGNYGYVVNALNQAGIGQPDIATMAGIQPEGVYTFMNRPSPYTSQFYQPIYQPQYSSYSASPQATFGVASYGTSPMMRQDIMTRGMQTVPYYGFGGGNLDMFGIPSVRTPFTYFPQQTGLGQNFSFDQRRTVQPVNPTDPRVVFGGGGGGGTVGGGGVNIGGGGGGSGVNPIDYTPIGDTFSLDDFTRGAYPPGGTQMFGGGFGGFGGFGSGFNDLTMGSFGQPDIQTSMRTPIVTRSAQARGTPNVMRRAEGGIADLLKK
jgi:hypothetical protein